MALKNIAVGLGAGSVLMISMFLALFGMGGQGGLLASLSGSSAGTATITVIKDTIPDENVEFKFAVSGSTSTALPLKLTDNGNGSNNTGTLNLTNVTDGEERFVSEVGVDQTIYGVSYECVNFSDETRSVSGLGPIAKLVVQDTDEITCKFTNSKKGNGIGSIKIIKDAGGNDGTDFKFTLTSQIEQPRDFTLDDDGVNDNTYENNETFNVSQFPNELEYTVTETSSSDEYFVSYECFAYKSNDRNTKLREWSGLGNVNKFKMYDINALYNVECVFKNTHTNSSITVGKVLFPPDATREFEFNITESGQLQVPAFKITTPDPKKVALLPNKTYRVKEILTDQEIRDGKYAVSYECLLGSNVVASGSGTETTDLPLGDNENIICTFTNVDIPNSTTSITIQKITNPTPNTTDTFEFQINNRQNDDIVLKDGESKTITESITEGTYRIEEISGTEDGHKYTTTYDCTSDKNSNHITGSDPFVEGLQLATNENITCVFTNTRNSAINIIKKTLPVVDDSTIKFNFNVQNKTVQPYTSTDHLIPGGGNEVVYIPNGSGSKRFKITEQIATVPASLYRLNDIECVSNPGLGGLTHGTKTRISTDIFIDNLLLYPGEVYDCTFTNASSPTTISVKKITNGDHTKEFPFLISTGSGAPLTPVFELNHTGVSLPYSVPGTSFIVEETNTFGYIASYSCAEVRPDGTVISIIKKSPNDGLSHPKAEFTVPNYTLVTCTFTNTLESEIPTIRIIKKIIPSENKIFDFKIESDDDNFQTQNFQLGDGSNIEFKVGAGFNYSILELIQLLQDPSLGYKTTYSCTSNKRNPWFGSGVQVTINPPIQLGEHIICTFTNCKGATCAQ